MDERVSDTEADEEVQELQGEREWRERAERPMFQVEEQIELRTENVELHSCKFPMISVLFDHSFILFLIYSHFVF